VQSGLAILRTRTGLDWTERFAAIAKDAAALPDCLIDGEVVALDKRRLPSFGALQAALAAESSEDLVYFAFDLLFEGREDREIPLKFSDRSKTPIEPYLADQWFVKMGDTQARSASEESF
jgi:bifunctional non-homologous end joining protein LigD